MSKCCFVTGADTEVGKTVANCALLRAMKTAGYRAAGYRPMTSGSEKTPKGLRDSNALVLQRNSSLQLDYATVSLYTFVEPVSPHIIGVQEDRPIEALVIGTGLRALEQQTDWMLMEGAGGWFAPLSDTFTFADWVTQEQLPVILVVDMKLGCVSHTVLATQAILHAELTLAGRAANDVTSPGKRRAEYMTTLIRMIPTPLLGEIPWLAENPENAVTGKCINLALT